MKRISILVVCFVILTALVAVPVQAQQWAGSKNTQPFTSLQTLVSTTTTSVVTGSVVTLGIPFSDITCIVSNPSASAPSTNVVTRVLGGIDGTNLVSLKTVTSTTFPDIYTTRSATAVPVTSYRVDIVSESTVSAAGIKVECIASH